MREHDGRRKRSRLRVRRRAISMKPAAAGNFVAVVRTGHQREPTPRVGFGE